MQHSLTAQITQKVPNTNPHVSTAVASSTVTSFCNCIEPQGKKITNIVKEATSGYQTAVHVLSFNIGGCRVKLIAQLSNTRSCLLLHKA